MGTAAPVAWRAAAGREAVLPAQLLLGRGTEMPLQSMTSGSVTF